MKLGHSNRIHSLQDQILIRTIALDPKYNDCFASSGIGCKCGGTFVRGTDSSGYAKNYYECIKCRKSYIEEDRHWGRKNRFKRE